MTKENITVTRIVSIVFVFFLFVGFIKNGSYTELDSISRYLEQEHYDGENAITVNALEGDFISYIWKKRELIELNGFMADKLNMQGFYGDIGVYVTDDKYIVSGTTYTSTDYEVSEIIGLRDFLAGSGINLLYVNKPEKYTDDLWFSTEFGIETYRNRNADVFLKRIRQAGVNVIDLRENLAEENINALELFYRTDHHWTTNAGLWATQIIAEGLNKYCGYYIDTSIYDISNYYLNEWTDCWLGEQGRKVGKSYVGLDNYTEIKPKCETSYIFKKSDGSTWEGSFDDFINESIYNVERDVYESESWHYSYRQISCINNNVESGKILLLGDSFDQVTEPFISLGVHEIDSIILREQEEGFDLRNHILENGYDTVIICYAQTMIGAHEVKASSNYRMFSF